MRVLAALSGGVDSSVAAAILRDDGHEVTAVTLRLWGGDSDSGCCAISDVDDARRSADRLGIEHLVWNYGEEFERDVVGPYVDEHRQGRTPNPCVACNRHLKFGALLGRAELLGFDAVATGHHARRVHVGDGEWRLARGTDPDKDQSYVLHPLVGIGLDRVLFPIGGMTKAQVRARASTLGLPTAGKPDSQDVCFITRAAGRRAFLESRGALRPALVVDLDGSPVGHTDAVEMVTIGQRKGLSLSGGTEPRFVVDVRRVDGSAEVVVGPADALLVGHQWIEQVEWVTAPGGSTTMVAQTSAHGDPAGVVVEPAPGARARLRWRRPVRRVAPGQSIVLYEGDIVMGAGIAAAD